MVLQSGDYPGLSAWAQCNHKGSHKREATGSKSEKEVLGGRPMNQGMRTRLEAGKSEQRGSLLEPPGGTSSVHSLTLAQWDQFWTSDRQS